MPPTHAPLERFCRLALSLIALALAITATYGLVNDDYLFIRVYDLQFYGNDLSVQILRTFAFFPSPAENLDAIARGYTQANWFTSTAIEHRFFRPLAALTHYFDYRAGSIPVLMHFHNFLYIGLAAWLMFRLFARIELTREQQWLLVALFFIDTASLWAGWIAQRNAWMALSALLAAVLAYIQHTESGKPQPYLTALAFLTAGLWCSEAGIVISVYLFFLPLLFRQSLFAPAHLGRMIPVALLCLCYLWLYRGMEFGVSNHPLYTNPMTETAAAIASLGIKIPAFTLSSLGLLPAEMAYLLERTASRGTLFVVFGSLNLVAAFLLFASCRYVKDKYRGLYLYGIASASGAMLPLMGSMIADRSGTFVKIGMAMALGACILQMMQNAASPGTRACLRALPWILVTKAVFALVVAVGWAIFLLRPDPALQPLHAMSVTPRHVVYLKVHDIFFTSYILEKIQFHHDRKVETAQRLVADNGRVILERIDADSITLSAEGNGYLLDVFDLPMEPANFAAGNTYTAGFMQITALKAQQGLPQSLRVDFSIPPETITFLNYNGKEYQPVILPASGRLVL